MYISVPVYKDGNLNATYNERLDLNPTGLELKSPMESPMKENANLLRKNSKKVAKTKHSRKGQYMLIRTWK